MAAVNLAPAGFNLGTGAYYSPDGSQIAFAGRTGSASWNSVYVMNADGSGVTSIVPMGSRHQSVLGWGASGILYTDFDGTNLTFPLWRVSPVAPYSKAKLTSGYTVQSANYSPDGSKIAIAAAQLVSGKLQPYALYVLAGGPMMKITTTPAIVPNTVAWAPTGDRVAVTGYAVGDSGHYKLFKVDLNLVAQTGVATAVASATGTNSLGGVYWGDLEDPLTPTQISTVDVSGQYGETVTLSATLKTFSGTALSGKTVNLKLGGTVVATGLTDASGLFTATWKITVAPGTYPITAEFAGDVMYNSSTTTPLNDKTLTVTKAITTLTLPTKTLVAGDPLTLSGNLSALAAGLSGKSISIKVNGSPLTTLTTDASGNYTYTYTPALAAGTYTVQADYAGDTNYTSATASFNLVVTKAPTTLTTTSSTINYLQPVTLSATLTKTTGGAPINGEPITFKVNGAVVATVNTNSSGVATYTYTPTLPGATYTIDAIYPGSGTYQNSAATGTLTVQKAVTTLTAADKTVVYGDTVNLEAVLMAGASPVAGATVQFKVGATVLGTKLTDATGKAVWPNYSANQVAGDYTITATYAGDASYEASSDTATLTITKRPVNIVVNPATTDWSYPVNLTATLTAAGGAPLSNQSLVFKVGATTLGTKLTDATGKATLNWPANSLPPGNYTLTVEFAGDSAYQSGTGSAALTINKAPTTLTGQNVTLTYGVNGQIIATLKSGTTPISGKQISFVIDGGAPLTATTDATGKATLTYAPNLAAGTYTINLAFAGDTNYLGATATATLTVQKATVTLTAADATVEFGKPVTLEATLAGPTGPINGATLTFVVDGATVGTGPTDATGKATFTYTPSLAAGNYVVQVTYPGDAYYLNGSDSAQLTVTKALSAITVANVTITYAANGTLTATLKDASGNPISGRSLSFKVNGTAAGSGTTIASGVATVSYTPTQAAGSYTITVDFGGDGFYEASSGTGTLTVDKAASTLVAADKSVIYNQTVGLTATLIRTADGAKIANATVTFKVNGATVGTGLTDVNGVATYNWKANLAAGTYPIAVDFAGDTFYLATTEGAHTVTVTKAATTIVAVDKTVVYGQTVALTATLTEAAGNISGRTVEFFVNGTSIGTGSTNATGVASVNWTANLAAGTYTIKADFAGDTFYLASSDSTHSVTVT
ncbi:MAG TPA: Ig-like domain repeat protein, partial [Symbiobacteriaceae bacterium]|nr:Ig-like domain repeat protein [Symbiobacteriaceae bacterium]